MKWFKHDADANRDDKLEKVLMKYGAEGYALYWLCLELIASPIDKHNINFELKHDAEILAYRLKMDSAKVEEIMRYFVSQKLFECDSSTGTITCLKLARRIENSIVKNPQLSEIQRLIESRTTSDNSGQSGKASDDAGKPQLDTDRDTDTEFSSSPKGEEGQRLPASPPCPYQKIVDLYHKTLPMCPRVVKLTDNRKSHLRARWRNELPALEKWRNYFSHVSQSDFLTGRTNGSNGRPPFLADLDWLIKPGNLVKVAEGKYHRSADDV